MWLAEVRRSGPVLILNNSSFLASEIFRATDHKFQIQTQRLLYVLWGIIIRYTDLVSWATRWVFVHIRLDIHNHIAARRAPTGVIFIKCTHRRNGRRRLWQKGRRLRTCADYRKRKTLVITDRLGRWDARPKSKLSYAKTEQRDLAAVFQMKLDLSHDLSDES